MTRALLLLLWILGVGCSYVPVDEPVDEGELATYEQARVRQVLAGNIILVDDGGAGRKVRYAGVEAPSEGSPFWSQAKSANARMVEGQDVRIVPVEHDGEGEYAYVIVPNASNRGGLLVQFELARLGLVRPADVPRVLTHKYFDGILERAEAARRESRGIWAEAGKTR